MTEQRAERPRHERLRIEHGWLLLEVDEHTCGAGGELGHEPSCGLEPVMTLAELDELLTVVGATGAPINRPQQVVAVIEERGRRAERIPEATADEVERAKRYVLDGLADDLGDPTKPNGYTLAVLRARRDAREEVLRPFRELFSGGPDTTCRTRHRPDGPYGSTIECVEVPLDDLRVAFVEAGDRQ